MKKSKTSLTDYQNFGLTNSSNNFYDNNNQNSLNYIYSVPTFGNNNNNIGSRNYYFNNGVFHMSNELIHESLWRNLLNDSNFLTSVKKIELNGTTIDSIGLRYLSEIIQRSRILEIIKIEWNYLNQIEEEFFNFCDFLSKLSTLRVLSLTNNKLSDSTISGILNVLCNPSLHEIDLRWNEFSDISANKILNFFQKNENFGSNLRFLNLNGNHCSTRILNEIQMYLSNKKKNLSSSSVNFNQNFSVSQENLNIKQNLQKVDENIKEGNNLFNNESLRKEIEGLKEKNKVLEEQLNQEKEKLYSEKANFNLNLSSIETNYSNLSLENNDLKNNIIMLRTTIEENQRSYNETLNSKEKNQSETVRILETEIERMRNENKELKESYLNEMENLNKKYLNNEENLTKIIKNLKNENNSLLKENNDLKTKISQKEIQSKQILQESVNSLKNENILEQEKIINTYDRKIKELHETNEFISKQIDDVTTQLNDLREKSTQEIKKLKDENEKLLNFKISLSTENNELKNNLKIAQLDLNKTRTLNEVILLFKKKNHQKNFVEIDTKINLQKNEFNSFLNDLTKEFNETKNSFETEKNNLKQELNKILKQNEILLSENKNLKIEKISFAKLVKQNFNNIYLTNQ